MTALRDGATHDNPGNPSEPEKYSFKKSGSIEDRDQKAKKIIESPGGKMLSLFYPRGWYDFVAVIDVPSRESQVKFLSIVAKFGTVRSETPETISPACSGK